MKNAFTLDDLISFAYSETNDLDEKNLFENLGADKRLKDEFKNLFSDSAKVSPEKRIIDNIMSYAHALCVIKTKKAGVLTFIMN
ncbi:MAG: hypothetical protein K8R86_10145 [Bacteroidales bacterium]|nr:hypothetical protein [Bacteroidales bacterium]